MIREWNSEHDSWAVYGGGAPIDDATRTSWRESVDDDTPPVRLIAHSPYWFWGTLGVLYAFSFANPLATVATGVAAVVGMLAVIHAAFRDRTLLTQRGAYPVASPLWMFLSPIAYLVARSRALKSVPGYRHGFVGWYLIGFGIVVGCVLFFLAAQGLIGAAAI